MFVARKEAGIHTYLKGTPGTFLPKKSLIWIPLLVNRLSCRIEYICVVLCWMAKFLNGSQRFPNTLQIKKKKNASTFCKRNLQKKKNCNSHLYSLYFPPALSPLSLSFIEYHNQFNCLLIKWFKQFFLWQMHKNILLSDFHWSFQCFRG